jgi:hypothetical protein
VERRISRAEEQRRRGEARRERSRSSEMRAGEDLHVLQIRIQPDSVTLPQEHGRCLYAASTLLHRLHALCLALVLRLLQQILCLPLAIVIPNLPNARLRIVSLHSAIIPRLVLRPVNRNRIALCRCSHRAGVGWRICALRPPPSVESPSRSNRHPSPSLPQTACSRGGGTVITAHK